MELSSWEAAGIAAKALTYAFSLTVAGGAIFIFFFARLLRGDERAHFAQASCALALAAAVFTALRLPIIAGTLGGDLSGMSDWSLLQFVFESSEGVAAAVRAAGLALIPLVLLPSVAASAIAFVGALLVAASFAFTGHSQTLGVLPQILVTVHLIGVSYWLGAFYPLRHLTYRPDVPGVAHIMKRFGAIALYVVGALIAAGATLLWILLEAPLAMLDSGYGRVLAVKLLLVSGLLALAATNKLLLTPALLRGDVAALLRLRRSITAELALAALVLLVTATLTTVTGPPALE